MKVLIVDDDPGLQATLNDILNVKGIEAVIAKTGGAALAQVERQDIDVAVIDLRLEDVSGLEVLHGIRQRSPDTECILLTGHATQDSAIEAVNLGAYSYYQKPFNMDQLLLSIRRAGERRASAKLLRESEVRYRSLFEDSPISLWEEDFSEVKRRLDALRKRGVKDFRAYLKSHPQVTAECAALVQIVDVNKATLELYQAGSKEELLKNLVTIFGDDSYESFREELVNIAEGKTQFNWEGVNRTLDGRRLNVSLNWSAAPGHESDLSKVIVSIMDITERKQAEEALRRSESSLHAILHSTADGILAIGSENEVLYANERFMEMWRIPQAVMASKDDSALLQYVLDQLSNPQTFLKKVQELYKSKEESLDTLNFTDGRVFERLSHPLLHGTELRGRVWSFRDITERQQAEREIQRRNEELAFLNVLNTAVNRGESLESLTRMISKETEILFNSMGVTLHLLDPIRQRLVMQNLPLSPALVRKIEKVIGVSIPRIEHDLNTDHPYRQVIESGKSKIINALEDIQDFTAGYLSSAQLTDKMRSRLRSFIPAIVKLLGSHSVLVVPLISDSEVIGTLDMSRREPFNEEDAKRLEIVAGQFTIIIKRKQAEAALRVAEEKYRTLVEQSPVVTYEANPGGRSIYISPQVGKFLGFSPAEWLADPDLWSKQIHPEDKQRIQEVNAHALSEGNGFVCEYRLVKKDGSSIWIHDEGRPVKSAPDAPPIIQGIWQDVTERKQAEETLRALSTRQKAILAAVPDILMEVNKNKVYTWANPAGVEFFGENVIGKEADFYFEGEQDTYGVVKPLFKGSEDTIYIESWQRRKDGEKRLLAWWCRTLKDADGNAVGALSSAHDITERKRAEETLRASERRYQTLAEVSPAGIFRTDADGLTTYVNRRWCEISGMSAKAALGNGWLKAVHPDDRAKLTEEWQAAVEKRDLSTSDYRFLKPDGSITWVIGQAVPEKDEQGRIVGYIGAITDITQRKRSEQEILRRMTELEVLYENGIAISRILEPHEIGEKIIEIFSRKLNWHHAAIRLFDPRRNRMRVLAFNHPGLTEEERLAHIEKLRKKAGESGKGLSGWVVQHGESVLCPDVRQDERYVRTYPGIRSGLYAPLKAGQQIIGSISIESTRLDAFREQDLRLLETVAAQAAVALENARLYQDTVRSAERRAVLYRASQEIAAAGLDLEQVYQSIHQAAAQLMPLDLFTIVLADETQKALHAVYLIDRGERYPPFDSAWGAGLSGHVIREKKSLRVTDYQKNKPAKAVWFGGAGVPRSIIAVPLHSGAQIVGVLSVQDYQPDIYNEEDEILLKTLGAYAGTAIENSRLFESEREQHHLSDTLRNALGLGASLSSTLDFNEVLDRLLEAVEKILPYDDASIMLVDHSGEEAVVAQTRGRYLDRQSFNGFRFNVATTENMRWMAEHKQPLVIPDVTSYPGWLKIDGTEAIRSWAGAPIIVNGEVLAFFSLNKFEINFYSPEHARLLEAFTGQASLAFQNARLFAETQSRLRFLSALHTIDTAISASVDLRITLNIILENVTGELEVDAAAVALLNPHTRVLEYTASRGFRSHIVEGMRIKLGEGLAGRAALQRRIIKLSEVAPADGKNRSDVDIFADEQFASQFAIPLTAKGQVQGVLQICHRTELNPGQEWLDFLDTLSGQAAIALDNARMFDNLQRSNLDLLLAYDATIQGWSQALDMRDRETEGHTRRVADMSMTLAGAMGMNEAELEHIRRGALLHDIGKIGVPDAILHKPGPLTDEEWVVMRTHPVKAYEMLSPIDYLRPALDIPYCHHEKWDGSGYPRGLKEEQIPLAARIFAVVDVFDALTSDRPYRPAWSKAKALKHIKQEIGKHFDPQAVEVFLKMMKQ